MSGISLKIDMLPLLACLILETMHLNWPCCLIYKNISSISMWENCRGADTGWNRTDWSTWRQDLKTWIRRNACPSSLFAIRCIGCIPWYVDYMRALFLACWLSRPHSCVCWIRWHVGHYASSLPHWPTFLSHSYHAIVQSTVWRKMDAWRKSLSKSSTQRARSSALEWWSWRCDNDIRILSRHCAI